MAQIHVITGVERRCRWSDKQKRAIIAAAFSPGAVVAEVARRADVCSALIYRWRRELESAPPSGFAEVVVAPSVSSPRNMPGPVIDVVVNADARVRIPASTSPDLATAIISALVRR